MIVQAQYSWKAMIPFFFPPMRKCLGLQTVKLYHRGLTALECQKIVNHLASQADYSLIPTKLCQRRIETYLGLAAGCLAWLAWQAPIVQVVSLVFLESVHWETR